MGCLGPRLVCYPHGERTRLNEGLWTEGTRKKKSKGNERKEMAKEGKDGREGWKERKMMQPGTLAKMCPTTYLVQQNDTSQAERFILCI